MEARVGQAAPEFEAKAYTQRDIKTIKLSDYKGQWVMLYFYPGGLHLRLTHGADGSCRQI